MNKWRWVTQIIFVTMLGFIGYRHQVIGGGPSGTAPIDAYCPLGALEALPHYLSSGELISKTALSNFWILGLVVLITIVFGAVFCGWMCPLGGLADWLYALRTRIYKTEFEITAKLERYLHYGRYAVLISVITMAGVMGKLWFENYDPFKLIFHMNVETVTAWIIIGLFIILSMMIQRFWCRFLCPLGGLLGIVSRISFLRISRDPQACIQCNKCAKVCPVKIPVDQIEDVNDSRCISCLQCVDKCPVPDALVLKGKIRTAVNKVKPITVGIVAVAAFLSILITVNISGVMQTKNPNMKIASQIQATSEIKGWMKWKDVISAFQADEAEIIRQLKLPNSFDRNQTIKTLAKAYDFSDEAFRELVEKTRIKK